MGVINWLAGLVWRKQSEKPAAKDIKKLVTGSYKAADDWKKLLEDLVDRAVESHALGARDAMVRAEIQKTKKVYYIRNDGWELSWVEVEGNPVLQMQFSVGKNGKYVVNVTPAFYPNRKLRSLSFAPANGRARQEYYQIYLKDVVIVLKNWFGNHVNTVTLSENCAVISFRQ